MSLPMVLSSSKPASAVRPCVQYEGVPGFLSQSEIIIETGKTNSTKKYFVQGTKLVKRKRTKNHKKSNEQRTTNVRLKDCEAALNVYSVKRSKNKPRKVAKEVKIFPNRQKVERVPSIVYCSVQSLITSYASSRSSTNTSRTKSTCSSNSPSLKKPQTSPKQSNCKDSGKNNAKQQICPPPIIRSKSLVGKEIKLRKVYYSEAHSQRVAGIPCAPPVSPVNDFVIAFEIIPSLADVKSQQSIKTKLKNLEKAQQKQKEKVKAQILKDEKRREQDEKERTKEQRRAEIYALNEVMTEHERKNFVKFITEKHNGNTTAISLNLA